MSDWAVILGASRGFGGATAKALAAAELYCRLSSEKPAFQA